VPTVFLVGRILETQIMLDEIAGSAQTKAVLHLHFGRMQVGRIHLRCTRICLLRAP
jgi:hypothetical protein